MLIDLCYQGMVNFNISIRFENIVWSLTRNLLTKMYACLSYGRPSPPKIQDC